jgi:hypothetical protein
MPSAWRVAGLELEHASHVAVEEENSNGTAPSQLYYNSEVSRGFAARSEMLSAAGG